MLRKRGMCSGLQKAACWGKLRAGSRSTETWAGQSKGLAGAFGKGGCKILQLGGNQGPLLLVPGQGMLQFFIGVPFLDNLSVAGWGAALQEEPCPWAARRLKLMLLMEV